MKNSLFILLVFCSFKMAAQKNSVQLKLISTEDFRRSGHSTEINFEYNYGIYYQREITKKFHLTAGGTYSKIDRDNNCYGCYDFPAAITRETGYYLSTKLGLKYYIKKGNYFNHFVEGGAAYAYAESSGEYIDFAWGQGHYKKSFTSNNYGGYLLVGSEWNISKKLFLLGAIDLVQYVSHYKYDHESYSGKESWLTEVSKSNLPYHFVLRFGYRF